MQPAAKFHSRQQGPSSPIGTLYLARLQPLSNLVFTTLVILIASFSAGCATSSSEVATNFQHGQLPWPVEVERGILKHQLVFGPYRTSWLGPRSSATAHKADKNSETIQTVSFAQAAARYEFDLQQLSGPPMHVSAGNEVGQKQSLALGKLKIPTGTKPSGITVGTLAQGGQTIGHFRIGLGSDDPNGMQKGDFQYGSLSIGETSINIVSHVEHNIWQLSMSALSVASLTFEQNGQKIAVAEWKPEAKLWIEESLPDDVKAAIASVASVYISGHRTIEDQITKEGAANLLGVGAAIAPAG
jgi:hypothetical protein